MVIATFSSALLFYCYSLLFSQRFRRFVCTFKDLMHPMHRPRPHLQRFTMATTHRATEARRIERWPYNGEPQYSSVLHSGADASHA
jgi:hypothetical protein